MQFYYFSLSNKSYFLIIIVIALFKAVHPQLIRLTEFSEKKNYKNMVTPDELSMIILNYLAYGYGDRFFDFSANQKQIIYTRDNFGYKVNILFQIHSPSPNIYETLTHEFCFQVKTSADSKCHIIPNYDTKINYFHTNDTVKWLKDKSGFEFIIEIPHVFDNDFTGFYYFKSSSPNSGMALSQYIEIRDYQYWERNMVFHYLPTIFETYKPHLTPSDMPKIFTCSDNLQILNSEKFYFWFPFEFKSLVRWVWCPIFKGEQFFCLCTHFTCIFDFSSYLPWKMPPESEIKSYQGSIAIIDGSNFDINKNQFNGFALVCFRFTENTYKKIKFIAYSYERETPIQGIRWNSTINERLNIELISPLNQTIEFGIMKDNFILTAFYRAPSEYTYNWTRFGKKLSNSKEWVVQPYSLKFTSKIPFNMRGTYHLNIASQSESFEFRITVIIITSPILINTSPKPILSTIYLMVKSNFSIKYSYNGNPTFANIYINEFLYRHNISDRKIFLDDLSNKYAHLKHLDFYFEENKLSDDITEYNYTVKNVLFKEFLFSGQDHTLIVEVGNEYGVSRSQLNIYVLKPPTFLSVPHVDDCTTVSSSSESHLFRCQLNLDYFTEREVQVEKFWFVNDMRLDSLPYHHLYFQTDAVGLTIMPLSSNSSESDMAVKALLKKAKLTCRVRLLYPGSLNMSDSQMIRENRIIYDTLHDPVFTSKLSTEIRIN